MIPVSELYDTCREGMRTGDCILWRSKSLIGWAIRMFSGGAYNHAGLVVRPHDAGCFAGRRFTLEALGNGIILRLLSERLRGFEGEVWLFPLKDDFDLLRHKILEWALDKEGTPYDYGSLFKQIFGRVSVDAKSYFCSEFAYDAWKEAGLPIAEDKAPRPGDIPMLPIFKEPIMIYAN